MELVSLKKKYNLSEQAINEIEDIIKNELRRYGIKYESISTGEGCTKPVIGYKIPYRTYMQIKLFADGKVDCLTEDEILVLVQVTKLDIDVICNNPLIIQLCATTLQKCRKEEGKDYVVVSNELEDLLAHAAPLCVHVQEMINTALKV